MLNETMLYAGDRVKLKGHIGTHLEFETESPILGGLRVQAITLSMPVPEAPSIPVEVEGTICSFGRCYAIVEFDRWPGRTMNLPTDWLKKAQDAAQA